MSDIEVSIVILVRDACPKGYNLMGKAGIDWHRFNPKRFLR
jgi:hypothetical protein